MKTKVVLLSIFLFICSGTVCLYADQIKWIHADFPPFSIPYGPNKTTGICDRVETLLRKNLTEYEHVESVANYKRIMTEFKNQSKVICTALLKNPEREKFIEFSTLSLMLFPNGAVILKSNAEKFKPFLNEKNELSLEKIIKANIKVGVSIGRSYSHSIDEALKKYAGHKAIIARSGVDVFKGHIKMLYKNRMDVVLGYPQEVVYVIKQLGMRDEIMFFPVEGMPQYITNWVGAPKNEWGKKIIAKINIILKAKRHTPEYLAFYENWIDENSIKRYRKITKKVYGK